MRYVTESITIQGDIHGTTWDNEQGTIQIDRTFRCSPRRDRRVALEERVRAAYADAERDRFPNSVIDARASVVMTRRSKLTGATRTRRFPLRRFASVAYLLDLPDEEETDQDETVPF